MKNTEKKLRKCHRPEKTEKTWEQQAIWYPGLNPGTEIEKLEKSELSLKFT